MSIDLQSTRPVFERFGWEDMLGVMPSVSVVVPTFNRDHLIEGAIGSVLDQTYDDFEIIVVDDGSTDNTESVVKGISSKKLRYVKHDQNRGGSAARNTGIKNSTGQYVAFLDSDDRWVRDKLQRQMDRFERLPERVGVMFGGCWRYKSSEKFYYPPLERVRSENWGRSMIDPLLKGSLLTLQTAVVRRECFETAGYFDEHLNRAQDWELSIRLAREFEFYFMNRPLAHSYVQSDSLSMDREAKITAVLRILRKHEDLFRERPRNYAKHYYRLGRHILDHGLDQSVRPFFWRAFLLVPYRYRYVLAALLSLLGNKFMVKTRRFYRALRYPDGN